MDTSVVLKVVLRLVVLASPENLIEMEILSPFHRTTESEPLVVCPISLNLNKPSLQVILMHAKL